MGVIFVLQPERGVIHRAVKGLAGLGNVRHSAWLSVGSWYEVRSSVCDIHI